MASGKSTVADLLREHGAVVIDADALAREVVARGTPGLARVVEAFGPDVLTADGELDRPRMGALVFADPEQRRLLESIVHPLVFERYAELEVGLSPDDLVVHDIPLLVETGRAGEFEAVLVVDTPSEVRVERMMSERGWTRIDAEARIAAQSTREERLAAATHVIDNGGTREQLSARVAQVVADLTAG